jgi:hypothetical protein
MKQFIISLIILALAMLILIALGKPADASTVSHTIYVNKQLAYGIGNIVWRNRETGQMWKVYHTYGALMCLPPGHYDYTTWLDYDPYYVDTCDEVGCWAYDVNLDDPYLTYARYNTYWLRTLKTPTPTVTPTYVPTATPVGPTPTPKR